MTSSTPSPESIRDLVRQVVDSVVGETPGIVGTPVSSLGDSSRERIAVGADHGGFAMKQELAERLRAHDKEVVDCGTHSQASVDYPDLALAVAQKVASGECRWGIVVDGAGIGSCMAANKVPGVRAALCYDLSSASK